MKLSKEFKDALVNKVVVALFKSQYEALVEEENTHVIRYYEDVLYTEKERKQMYALPADFFLSISTIWTPDNRTMRMKSSRRCAAKDANGYRSPKIPTDYPALGLIQAYWNKYDLVSEREKQVRKELNVLLAGCNTSNQLEATWPEGKEYYETMLNKPTFHALSVDANKLNQLIKEVKP